GPGEEGEKIAKAMQANPGFGDPTAKLPKPGEGPTKEERENGFYDAMFVGETAEGEVIQYGVKGKYDPGYGSTSRMITETGIALLHSDAAGGIGTPGSFLGEALVDRLQEHADINFVAEN
ncbi:MAG: saccharopine dehydrogenase, partial [Marinomonas sp.]